MFARPRAKQPAPAALRRRPAPGSPGSRVCVLCSQTQKRADTRRRGRGQSCAAAPAAPGSVALPGLVFRSRSRAATKLSKSMAVTTPNTICFLLDFPLLWSEEGRATGVKGSLHGVA